MDAAAQKQQYDEWRRKGLCVRCGRGRPPGRKRVDCESCAKTQQRSYRKRYAALVKSGLCRQCRHKPAERGGRCSPCAKKERERFKLTGNVTTIARRIKGVCRDCEAELSGDRYSRCPECRRLGASKRANVIAERKARGICVRCNKRNPARGKTQCTKCIDKRRCGRRKT